MTEDKLAFLDASDSAPATEQTATQEQATAPPATPPAPTADASQAPGTPPAPLSSAAKPEAKAEQHSVPLAKFLDTRDENKELKRQVADLQRQLQERTAQAPDPVADPEGYRTYVQGDQSQRFQQMLTGAMLNMSEQMARQSLGSEAVDAAVEAMREHIKTDPHSYQRVMQSQHPYAELVKWHQQHKLLSEIGDPSKFDDFVRARFAALQQQQQPGSGTTPAPITPPQAPAIPPPSLTRAPAAPKASDVPTGAGVAFDSAFG